jgi:hypothetical protein
MRQDRCQRPDARRERQSTTSGGDGPVADEVMQLVLADGVEARADLGSDTEVLGKCVDLLLREVAHERDRVALDLEDETRLVEVLARDDLDVLALPEQLLDKLAPDGELGAGILARRPADGDDAMGDANDSADRALVLVLRDLGNVAGWSAETDARRTCSWSAE